MAVTFKKSDLTRAATAMTEAGFQLDRVEIAKDGRIVMFPKGAETKTELDGWLKNAGKA